ncbi:ThiF family adenylyltransferase [Amycolatopsis vastitatis]|uniref:THIF-type NAD/FAD binding fold domain-containing protein n=1 Tax=Amycolatopsis vastitatis TaxID=1905142 RepID=A0A229SMW1_9PSEU|nr:ThiF family adenylyltransferase [Amycolatopsis vastitatis]OXM60021.1 hypothetical protein CF165_44830 [Amycolatopsis vastitatis]
MDLISAGAITHATLYTLLRVPDFAADLRVIDFDILGRSNTNRYPLARAADLHRPKVDQLTDLKTDAVRIGGVRLRLNEDTLAAVGDLAPRVLVGVDDIPTRWFVQRQQPAWVGVGATSHAFVVVSDHRPGRPCAGCVHPLDDGNPLEEIPTIGFVSLWAGLLLAGTMLAVDARTRPNTRRIEAHRSRPTCARDGGTRARVRHRVPAGIAIPRIAGSQASSRGRGVRLVVCFPDRERSGDLRLRLVWVHDSRHCGIVGIVESGSTGVEDAFPVESHGRNPIRTSGSPGSSMRSSGVRLPERACLSCQAR